MVLEGRYLVGPRLGGGGASEVFRALDIRLDRPVAVKLFRGRAGAHSDRRCGDEARLLAGFNHPGLVDVYDAGWHEDREFLVLQLVEGQTLGRRIAAGALTSVEVVRTGVVLAEALDHVHDRGIVHRDVKPSNVLCGVDGSVFLADFGISHLAGSDGDDRPGVVIGTAPYLAPEQVQGGPVGPPCDVYALGLVLLECLTGKREYPGGQIEAALARLHREPVVPPETPEPLGRLIRAMTALDPCDRPTAAQCRAHLAAELLRLAPVLVPAEVRIEAPASLTDADLPTVVLAPLAPVPHVDAVIAEPLAEPHVGSAVEPDAVVDGADGQDDPDVEGEPHRPGRPRRSTGAHRRRRAGRSSGRWTGVGATLGSALWPQLGGRSASQLGSHPTSEARAG